MLVFNKYFIKSHSYALETVSLSTDMFYEYGGSMPNLVSVL
jgi:hypothetical protein